MDWANGRNTGVTGLGRTQRTGGRTDAAEYGILDGADWGGLGWTGWTRGLADAVDAADYGILDGAGWGGRGGLGRTGRTGGLADWPQSSRRRSKQCAAHPYTYRWEMD